MPLITKVEVQKNDETRVNVYVDDKFYVGISMECVIKNHIAKGREIDLGYLDSLVLDDQKTVAMAKATKYMGGALKTTKQIEDYLKKKDFATNTIDHVIQKLQEYGYLDDENYAKSFVLTYSNKYGKLKLKSMLKSKGVSDKIIDGLFGGEVEMADSMEAVATKYLKNKEINEKNIVKLARFLISRGYEFDKVNGYIRGLRGRE